MSGAYNNIIVDGKKVSLTSKKGLNIIKKYETAIGMNNLYKKKEGIDLAYSLLDIFVRHEIISISCGNLIFNDSKKVTKAFIYEFEDKMRQSLLLKGGSGMDSNDDFPAEDRILKKLLQACSWLTWNVLNVMGFHELSFFHKAMFMIAAITLGSIVYKGYTYHLAENRLRLAENRPPLTGANAIPLPPNAKAIRDRKRNVGKFGAQDPRNRPHWMNLDGRPYEHLQIEDKY